MKPVIARSAAQIAAWDGVLADPDVAALAEMIDAVLSDLPAALDDDDPATEQGRALLLAQGLWSIGMPDAVGGGGAPLRLLLITLARLARGWPALAFSCAHAHAAVSVLATDPAWAHEAAAVADGAPIAVAAPASVPIRVDVCDREPQLLVVESGLGAALVPADAAAHGPLLARTGLAGARTHHVDLAGTPDLTMHQHSGDPFALLHLQAAAIACGIASGALAAGADYVVEREQFGAPLAALPTVARAVFDARADVAAAFDRVLALAEGDAGPVAAASALRAAFAAAIPAAGAAIQLHGGYGYLQEYPVERAMRDLVSLRAALAVGPVLDAAAVSMYAG